jgi:hypothetical protein
MWLLLVALYLCGPAWASDEVDYSAPYVTLEDGKLVTKYPAKPHTNAAPRAAADAGAGGAHAADAGPARSGSPASRAAADPAETGHPKALLAAAAAVAGVAAAAVLLARRRTRARRL